MALALRTAASPCLRSAALRSSRFAFPSIAKRSGLVTYAQKPEGSEQHDGKDVHTHANKDEKSVARHSDTRGPLSRGMDQGITGMPLPFRYGWA